MGIPLAGDFDVAVTKPVDSRMVWTGNINNLNNIPNKYPGLTCYITGNKNLYVYQDNNIWEEIVKTNIDFVDINTTVFNLDNSHNGKILCVNNNSNVNIFLPNTDISNGYNTSIIQMGSGSVILNNSSNFSFTNPFSATGTAGRYALISLLRVGTLNTFLLYGDVAYPQSSSSENQGGISVLDFPVYSVNNKYASGCWPYVLDLPLNQKTWRKSNVYNRIFQWKSALAISADGKYQTAASINKNFNSDTFQYVATDGVIMNSSNSGISWSINLPFNNYISVAMNENGQYRSALVSSCIWESMDANFSTLCPITGLKIVNSNDYGNTWLVSDFSQLSGVWSKILMNDVGNMRVVISENTSDLLISYNSGVTWTNSNTLAAIGFRNIAMNKDGKYLIALGKNNLNIQNGSRIYFSNNSGQTWITGFQYKPIHFEPYRIKTTGTANSLQTGEALYKYYGLGQKSEIYLHKYNLDGEPTVWNAAIQGYPSTQELIIRSKNNPNQQYDGRYVFPDGLGENAPNTIRIPFGDSSPPDPQLVFNNDNTIYYISPKGGFDLYTSLPIACAAISNDGKVQVLIDPHTSTNYQNPSTINSDYPGICISHDSGVTWREIAYRNRGLFQDTGYCTIDVAGYSVPRYDLAMDGAGKNLFLNNFFYSENSGISWSNRKVGKIGLLSEPWVPSNVKISNDSKMITMTQNNQYDSLNRILNIDNFFERSS
jgi:hypothetical protein